MKKKKVIVLGGSGFLGSHVADMLSQKGYHVTIIDKIKSIWVNPDQVFIKGDILEPEKFLSILKKTDYVYNFAAVSDIGEANKNPEETVKINIFGLVKLLNLCVKSKIKKYIHASTIYVSGTHGGFYKSSKLAAESYIKEFFNIKKLKYNILRYGSIYGPRSDETNGLHNIIKDLIRKNKIIYSGDPEAMRDYVHVIDAARVSMKVLSKEFDNKTIIISGPQTFKIKDVLKIISEISGVKNISYIAKNEVKRYSHYLRTPYSIDEKEENFSMKYTDNLNVDIGQGIRSLIKELRKEYK